MANIFLFLTWVPTMQQASEVIRFFFFLSNSWFPNTFPFLFLLFFTLFAVLDPPFHFITIACFFFLSFFLSFFLIHRSLIRPLASLHLPHLSFSSKVFQTISLRLHTCLQSFTQLFLLVVIHFLPTSFSLSFSLHPRLFFSSRLLSSASLSLFYHYFLFPSSSSLFRFSFLPLLFHFSFLLLLLLLLLLLDLRPHNGKIPVPLFLILLFLLLFFLSFLPSPSFFYFLTVSSFLSSTCLAIIQNVRPLFQSGIEH
ncbi:unnamed protein product [Acanthosepion pharaonis]|uniref:Uncharacterized protein n=1 Tax=Acanthosepion pharaonis TaxID=158019 RepID=A0A812ERQ9_ACAPH|nr:unnamed protein product [Sepia pharaonis]